jgi:hypothetical protein
VVYEDIQNIPEPENPPKTAQIDNQRWPLTQNVELSSVIKTNDRRNIYDDESLYDRFPDTSENELEDETHYAEFEASNEYIGQENNASINSILNPINERVNSILAEFHIRNEIMVYIIVNIFPNSMIKLNFYLIGNHTNYTYTG